MDNVKLRDAKPGDAEAVYEMMESEHWHQELVEMRYWMETFPGDFLVAELDGKTVGAISAIPYGDNHAHVGNFIVEKSLRHTGIGRRIVSCIGRLASRILTIASVQGSIPVYKKLGFKLAENKNVSRYYGVKLVKGKTEPSTTVTAETDFDEILPYDRRIVKVNRERYLRAALSCEEMTLFVARQQEKIVGYSIICKYKDAVYRICPLYADDSEIAGSIISKILTTLPDNSSFTMDFDPYDEKTSQFVHVAPECKPLVMNIMHQGEKMPETDRSKIFFLTQIAVFPF